LRAATQKTYYAEFGSPVDIDVVLDHSSAETTQTYAKMVDRIRDSPTKYLEELMG